MPLGSRPLLVESLLRLTLQPAPKGTVLTEWPNSREIAVGVTGSRVPPWALA